MVAESHQTNVHESQEKFTTQTLNIDGWETKPSELFSGYFEIVKTRKNGDPITIHINPETGRVRKFAGESLFNPRIEKEVKMWQAALETFGINEQVEIGSIRRLKQDPSKGYEKVMYLEMPYMGVPIDYYQKINSREVSEETKDLFTKKMIDLVEQQGIFFSDMNSGNVLVRIIGGKEHLFPIDWESAQSNRVRLNTEYYIAETVKRCHKLFGKE